MIVIALIDHELGKIKLVFDDKPPPDVVKKLHEKQWKYNYTSKFWSKYQTQAAIEYAEELTGTKLISTMKPKDCTHNSKYVGTSGLTVCPTCNSLLNISSNEWRKIKDHIIPPEDKYER